jgi:hypothetical protein
MKFNKWILGLAIIGILSIIGCATKPETSVYNTEKLLSDAAVAATHTFNVYYTQQTATAPASADLLSARTTLYDTDRKLSATLALVDTLRVNYTVNPAMTNQSAMFAALQSASDQSSNIVALVHLWTGTGSPAK